MTAAINIAVCASETDHNLKIGEVSWDELVATLSKPNLTECNPCKGKDCPAKRGRAWIPATFSKPYCTDANVESLTLFVGDLDHLTEEQLAACARRLAGYRHILHATHSDAPGDRAMRAVIPLSRPVPVGEWRSTRAAIVNHLGLPGVDPTCKNPSRIYFRPSRPTGADFYFEAHEGKTLDVDALSDVKVSVQVPPAPETAENPAAGEIDVVAVRKRIEERATTKRRDSGLLYIEADRRDKSRVQAEMLERILSGEALAPNGQRDATLNSCLNLIAYAVMASWAVVAEVVRPSVEKMSAPEGLTHWMDEGADMYRRAQVSADKWRASVAASMRACRKPTTASAEAPVLKADWSWELLRDGKGNLRKTGENINTILRNDPEVGAIRWNLLRKTFAVSGSAFDAVSQETLPTEIANWLSRKYALDVRSGLVAEQVLAIARRNAFNPVADYLNGLVWDGTERIDTWLEHYAGAATANDDGVDITVIVRKYAAKFLVQLVARGLVPGCRADCSLVLEGAQGIRKSTAVGILAGEWYHETPVVIGTKDALISTARAWVLELAELVSFGKSGNESRKAFFTTRKDTFRPPYGRTDEEFPRFAVFVGTVNPDEDDPTYLTDATGNRRYWPVRCGEAVDYRGLERDRDQLLAEAVVRYLAFCAKRDAGIDVDTIPERWWFTRTENLEAEALVTASRVETVPEAMVDLIVKWWGSLSAKPEYVTGGELAVDVLKLRVENIEMQRAKIGRAAKKAGFTRKRLSTDGRPWVYFPGPNVRAARKTGAHLTSVPAPTAEGA